MYKLLLIALLFCDCSKGNSNGISDGWTLTKENGTALYPDGTKGVKPPLTLFETFSSEMSKLKGNWGTGNTEFRVGNSW